MAGGGRGAIASGDIKDIELAAGGGLDGRVHSRIIGYVIPIHDVLSNEKRNLARVSQKNSRMKGGSCNTYVVPVTAS